MAMTTMTNCSGRRSMENWRRGYNAHSTESKTGREGSTEGEIESSVGQTKTAEGGPFDATIAAARRPRPRPLLKRRKRGNYGLIKRL